MAVDLHPDIVRAINRQSNTPLGRRYNRFARKRYGVSGKILAGKTVAGEFGGRSTATGRGVVSSAGARGPAQFIASTRDAYKDKYGVDPWAGDRQAIKGMMLHHLNTGVEGYNPGMPTYKDYILKQRLNADDRRALRQGRAGGGGAGVTRGPGGSIRLQGAQHTDVSRSMETIPGQSFAAERKAARTELLLGGNFSMDRLLEYKSTVNSLKDVPARQVSGDLQVTRTRGKGMTVPLRGGEHPAGPQEGKVGGLQPRGKWAGTLGPMEHFEKVGKSLGLQVTSAKRNNTNPYSGSRSDHDYGNEDATARDMSNGSQPTPEMDAYAAKVARTLGIKYKKGTPINATVVKNGIRYQLIYRGDGAAFGGNHMNHVHLGAKRVGRGGGKRGVL